MLFWWSFQVLLWLMRAGSMRTQIPLFPAELKSFPGQCGSCPLLYHSASASLAAKGSDFIWIRHVHWLGGSRLLSASSCSPQCSLLTSCQHWCPYPVRLFSLNLQPFNAKRSLSRLASHNETSTSSVLAVFLPASSVPDHLYTLMTSQGWSQMCNFIQTHKQHFELHCTGLLTFRCHLSLLETDYHIIVNNITTLQRSFEERFDIYEIPQWDGNFPVLK